MRKAEYIYNLLGLSKSILVIDIFFIFNKKKSKITIRYKFKADIEFVNFIII